MKVKYMQNELNSNITGSKLRNLYANNIPDSN